MYHKDRRESLDLHMKKLHVILKLTTKHGNFFLNNQKNKIK